MKRIIISISVIGIFLVGFYVYGIWPRSNEYIKAYVEDLANNGLLKEDGAIYAAELEVDSEVIVATFSSQDYFGSLKECAIQAIVDVAERDNIELHIGFEDEIAIKKVLNNVVIPNR